MTKDELIGILNTFRSLPAETEVFEFKEAKNTYDFKKLILKYLDKYKEASKENIDKLPMYSCRAC